MGKRGKNIIAIAVVTAFVCMALCAVCSVAGDWNLCFYYGIVGCFAMLWAIYLEVYSHRE